MGKFYILGVRRNWYGHSAHGVHWTGLPYQSRAVRWVRPKPVPAWGLASFSLLSYFFDLTNHLHGTVLFVSTG